MRGRVLAAACLAQLMITLDVSVVNIALPAVRADLALGSVGLQWVVTAYALPFAGCLLLGGRVVDMVGVRAAFVGGMAAFTAASAVAGAAPGPEVLLAGRAAQGLAASLVAPAALAAITTTFGEGESRTRALARWTAMSIAGGTAGNLCGGVLTEFFGWRAVLLVNLPLGSLAIVLAVRALSAAGHEGRTSVGIAPAPLATGMLVVAAIAFAAVGEQSWGIGIAASGVAVVCLAAFVRSNGTARNPLIPPTLLAIRSVRWGNAGLLVIGATLVPMWFFLSLQVQVVLGYPPLMAGLAFLPHTVIQLVVGLHWTPRLLRITTPPRLVAAGAALLAGGFVWQSGLETGSAYSTAVLVPAVLIAVGAGLVNLPLTAMTVAGVPASDAGAAAGVMNCAKQVGGGMGLAVLVAATAAIGPPERAYGLAFLIMAALAAGVGLAALSAARPARADGFASP